MGKKADMCDILNNKDTFVLNPTKQPTSQSRKTPKYLFASFYFKFYDVYTCMDLVVYILQYVFIYD